MSKLKNPLFGFNVRGTLGRALSFRKRGSQTIAEKKPIPTDAKSLAQLSWRHMYQKAVALWHALSPAEQADWESQARSRHMTGFAWFMSQCLKPNPGIYLPLQGGTMSGDIDMDGHDIINHPETCDLTFIIDGGGSAITTGEKGHLLVDFACTIKKAILLADQAGSIKIDIWKDTYPHFPPTDADSICGGNEPEIVAGVKDRDNSLTGWTKNIGAQQILAFNVDTVATITRVTLTLEVQRA